MTTNAQEFPTEQSNGVDAKTPFEQLPPPEFPVELEDNVVRIVDRRQRFTPIATERRHGPGRRQGDWNNVFVVAERQGLARAPEHVFSGYVHPTLDQHERFHHGCTTEKDLDEKNLDLVHDLWRAHAAGYQAMKFVTPLAIMPKPDLFLWPDIDHARGDNIRYYYNYALKSEPSDPAAAIDPAATIRIADVPESGTFLDLPTAPQSAPHLYEDGKRRIDAVEDPERHLKEVGAFSRLPRVSRVAAYELIRRIIHEEQGNDEVWFFNVVSSTFDSFVKTYGPSNFIVVGDDITFKDDPRIRPGLTLRPTLVYPDRFIPNILSDYEGAKTVAERRSLGRCFLFMTEGLHPMHMTPHMYNVRQSMLPVAQEAETQEQTA